MLNKDSNLHSILFLAHRLEAFANRYIFVPMGLSSISVKIMGMLSHYKFLTPSQILEMTQSTKSNISQRLKFLEKEGYITRDYGKDSSDKRLVKVMLTDKGKEKLKSMKQIMKRANLCVENKFTKTELENHKAFVEKLHDIIDAEEKVIGLSSKNCMRS